MRFPGRVVWNRAVPQPMAGAIPEGSIWHHAVPRLMEGSTDLLKRRVVLVFVSRGAAIAEMIVGVCCTTATESCKGSLSVESQATQQHGELSDLTVRRVDFGMQASWVLRQRR